jgi:lipopolysaccharide transport system permease protein
MARNIYGARELIWQLFKRDFFAVHKKSFLGAAWIFISALLGILSWVFMNAAGVLRPGDVGMPYPAYVLLGTTMWGLFMAFYTGAADTLNSGQGFIMQVRYPHEALLAKQLFQQAANFVIGLVVTLAVLLLFRVIPSWQIVFLPVLVLPMMFLAGAIGLVVSALGVVAAEVRKLTDAVLGMLIFFTPIVYSAEATSGTYAAVIRWNPLTYLVAGVRDVVAYGRMDNWAAFFFATVASLALFVLALRFFYVAEEKIIEKMI